MKKIFIIYGLLLLNGNSIKAQNIEKDSINKLDEVVITAQFSPRSEKNSVYKINVINQKTIAKKAVVNLTELLRQELNIDFSNNAVFGSGIEMNGISKENIKILVDGVPLIGRVNGVLNLNQIDLNDVDHIEIIEGPVSVFYGTDALGGIINIITKKVQNKQVEGSVSGYYETVDAKKINANIGLVDGKNQFKFGASYYYFNGLNTDEDLLRKLNWPKKRQYSKNFKYLRDLGNFKLRLSSDFSEELLHVLGEVKHHKATDIDYRIKRFDNSLNLQGNLSDNQFVEATVSYLNYDRYDTSYLFKPSDNSITLIENNPNENANYFDTFITKVQYAQSDDTKKLNYVVGAEYNSDRGEGNRILGDYQIVTNISGFASVNYKINDEFEIQPAIRYTNNDSFGDLWSPAFNLKYNVNNNSAVRFAYGNGFRAPSIKELYLDWTPSFGPVTYMFRGNKDLKLESSQSFNLYYSYHKFLSDVSSLSLEPFVAYNEVKDLIGLSESKFVGLPINMTKERHYINLNRVKTLNTAVNLKYVNNGLKANLGVSYLGRYIEYSDVFNSGDFMFTPSVSSAVFYTVVPLKLDLNLFYKYSGKRKGHFIEKVAGEDVLQETTRDDFHNLDFSISTSFFNKKLGIILGAKNILDVTDIETFNQIGVAHERNIQLWGSSYFIKSTFKF